MPEDIKTQRTGSRNLLGVGLALLLATAAFFSGLHASTILSPLNQQSANLSTLFAADAQPSPEADLTEFWRVWELMDEKFAAASTTVELTTEERVQGAIDGLVDSFNDPYTTYMPPTDAAFFDDDISGNFSGVGMEVGIRDNLLTIIAPLSGMPAEQAGIMAGDVIVTIDKESTENMGVDKAVRLIRGEEGSQVVLGIFRAGATAVEDISIIRAQIEIPTVKTARDGEVFIITLYSFNALAEMKMQAAMREYVDSSAKKLIIDVRGNPGGYLQSAVAIASYFMPAGKVVLRESFGDGREEELYRSQGRTLKQFAPDEIVMLIDGGSASASEILAGALGQHDYATLIGVNSFGKGSVQELVNLPSGAALKVTIARWLTPDGTSISNGGLAPDIIVERTFEDRTAGRDPQLDAALQYLRGTYVAPVVTETVVAE